MAMKKMTRQMLGLAFAAVCLFAVRPALAEDYVIGAELALTGTYAWVGVPSREGLGVGGGRETEARRGAEAPGP